MATVVAICEAVELLLGELDKRMKTVEGEASSPDRLL